MSRARLDAKTKEAKRQEILVRDLMEGIGLALDSETRTDVLFRPRGFSLFRKTGRLGKESRSRSTGKSDRRGLR